MAQALLDPLAAATGGSTQQLSSDSSHIVSAILAGLGATSFTEVPDTSDWPAALGISFDPPQITLQAGTSGQMQETITVLDAALAGTTVTCDVDFVASGASIGTQRITITVPGGAVDEVCDDGLDNDGDGLVDIEDPDCNGHITATKYYDANANGSHDAGEPTVEGWKVTMADPSGSIAETTTAADGSVTVIGLAPASYTVAEGEANAWRNVSPAAIAIDLGPGESAAATFGNVCLGGAGAHTRRYWQNRNGAATFATDADGALALLAGLPLEDGNGNAFDPGTYQEFHSWIRSANARNAGHMLSAQLAAAALNVHAGFVASDALLYAPAAPSANAYGYTTLGALIDDAAASLADGSDSLAISKALDAANNDHTFVQPGPGHCPTPVFDCDASAPGPGGSRYVPSGIGRHEASTLTADEERGPSPSGSGRFRAAHRPCHQTRSAAGLVSRHGTRRGFARLQCSCGTNTDRVAFLTLRLVGLFSYLRGGVAGEATLGSVRLGSAAFIWQRETST